MNFSVMTVSKWFTESEKKVFADVVHTGDLIELQHDKYHHWGVGMRQSSKDHTHDIIQIVNLDHKIGKHGKVVCEGLDTFWTPKSKIRINNGSDRNMSHLSEAEITQQIQTALSNVTRKWHNCEHLAYWCRHGDNKIARQRQVSDVTKWGSLSASAGLWMVMSKRERSDSSKSEPSRRRRYMSVNF